MNAEKEEVSKALERKQRGSGKDKGGIDEHKNTLGYKQHCLLVFLHESEEMEKAEKLLAEVQAAFKRIRGKSSLLKAKALNYQQKQEK